MRVVRDVRVGAMKLSGEIFSLDAETHARFTKYPELVLIAARDIQLRLEALARELDQLESDTVKP